MIVKTNYLEILKSVANYMLDNIGNILSTNNVANTMTSNGRNINVRIALKYIEGLIESFFFYRANRYDIKGKQYLKTCEKYYFSDLGYKIFYFRNKSWRLWAYLRKCCLFRTYKTWI